MEYKVLTDDDIQFFQNLLKPAHVLVSDFEKYASDHTEQLEFFPDLVLKPGNTEEISAIVKYCNTNLLPITPRGAGTGMAGGALPIKGGIVLSMERLNRILEIDEKNFQITVEPAVVNFEMQKAVEEKGLAYPPDPASWMSSFIGGNIATNAGGPKAVKYGVTAQYVLNLEVVLPNGEVIWTGSNTLKNSTGYNLTQLFVGSEGTLGIITKAVLRLIPKPDKEVSLLVPFRNMGEACDAVSALFHAGVHPSTMEFMEMNAVMLAEEALFGKGKTLYPEEESFDIEAHLLISLDGNLEEELPKCVETMEKFDIGEILFAESDSEKDRIWELRRKISGIVSAVGYSIEEDTVVPRANLADLTRAMHELADKHRIRIVCYGHAGDGNLHIRLNHPVHKNSYNVPEMQTILKELFGIVKSLGGTISGEHGTGLTQKGFLPIVFSPANLELQRAIKKTIDPKNIMNPGKIV